MRTVSLSLVSLALLLGCTSTADVASDVSQGDGKPDSSEQVSKAEAIALEVSNLFDIEAEIASNQERLLRQHNIYFIFDSTSLSYDDKDVLNAHAAHLLANPDVKVAIEGHADDRGSYDYNADLAERRATAVAEYFRRIGVRDEQLIVRHYGETRSMSVYPAEIWFGHPKNRRVDLIY